MNKINSTNTEAIIIKTGAAKTKELNNLSIAVGSTVKVDEFKYSLKKATIKVVWYIKKAINKDKIK